MIRDQGIDLAWDVNDLQSDLRQVTELMARGEINAARDLVAKLTPRWPDSEAIQHWARVLAPPVAVARPAVRRRNFAAERTWLLQHGQEYPGCWLALLGDQLIAADPDPRRLIARIREIDGVEDALIYLQPALNE